MEVFKRIDDNTKWLAETMGLGLKDSRRPLGRFQRRDDLRQTEPGAVGFMPLVIPIVDPAIRTFTARRGRLDPDLL